MERPLFSDHLEAIKFICKDFWSELFKKQIDNLKTNHRGTFVLQDNRFRWLLHIPVDYSLDTADSLHRHEPLLPMWGHQGVPSPILEYHVLFLLTYRTFLHVLLLFGLRLETFFCVEIAKVPVRGSSKVIFATERRRAPLTGSP